MQLSCFETKLPNLMLKTQPKQLLGSLPLDIALPEAAGIYVKSKHNITTNPSVLCIKTVRFPTPPI
jgi:hypothetical protein